MSVKRVLAGAAGADVDAAVPWSERLSVGPPTRYRCKVSPSGTFTPAA